MTFKYRYRKQIIIISIIVVIIGSLIFAGYYYFNDKEDSKKKTNLLESTKKNDKEKETKKEEITEIMVDIKGEVINQGIYKLKTGSRVIDQTTPNMIQRIIGIFERKPLISKEI